MLYYSVIFLLFRLGENQQDTELKVLFAGNEPENPEAVPLNRERMLEMNKQCCPEMVPISEYLHGIQVCDRQEQGPYRPAF